MKPLELILCFLVAGVLPLTVAGIGFASSRGLFAEQSASAGGIEVRRFRDTSNGVVCYAAKGQPIKGRATSAFSVAISCVREGQP